jgi:hypothetical protein
VHSSSQPAKATDENSTALANTDKTSVSLLCPTFRSVGLPKARSRHMWLSENVISPKSLTSVHVPSHSRLRSTTPVRGHLKCVADGSCRQHIAPPPIRLAPEASGLDVSVYTTYQSTLGILFAYGIAMVFVRGGILQDLDIRCGRATLTIWISLATRDTSNELLSRDTKFHEYGHYAIPSGPPL